jgi:hypothetical protein
MLPSVVARSLRTGLLGARLLILDGLVEILGGILHSCFSVGCVCCCCWMAGCVASGRPIWPASSSHFAASRIISPWRLPLCVAVW